MKPSGTMWNHVSPGRSRIGTPDRTDFVGLLRVEDDRVSGQATLNQHLEHEVGLLDARLRTGGQIVRDNRATATVETTNVLRLTVGRSIGPRGGG